MKLLDLVKTLREDILDDLGGYGMDWTLSETQPLLRWSNTQLTRYLNEAEKEVARRTKMFLDASYKLNLKAGKSIYQRDPKILQVRSATLASDNNTVQVNTSILDIQRYRDWESSTGIVSHLVSDYKPKSFFVYRQPSVDDILNLVVWRYPLEDLSWDNSDWQELEVPDEYTYSLCFYAAFLAYQKDEAQTRDIEKANYYLGLFDQEYGPKESTYSEYRKKRRFPREGEYGGPQIRSSGSVRTRRNYYGISGNGR